MFNLRVTFPLHFILFFSIQMEKKKDARITELEDIICTLKFEINGLKSVVLSLEDDAQVEREKVKKEFQIKVDEIFGWMDEMRLEINGKMEEICKLEEKVWHSSHFFISFI